jgi:hypothetical protein
MGVGNKPTDYQLPLCIKRGTVFVLVVALCEARPIRAADNLVLYGNDSSKNEDGQFFLPSILGYFLHLDGY